MGERNDSLRTEVILGPQENGSLTLARAQGSVCSTKHASEWAWYSKNAASHTISVLRTFISVLCTGTLGLTVVF